MHKYVKMQQQLKISNYKLLSFYNASHVEKQLKTIDINGNSQLIEK